MGKAHFSSRRKKWHNYTKRGQRTQTQSTCTYCIKDRIELIFPNKGLMGHAI